MKILLAKQYGLCFGVKRALKLAKMKAKLLNDNFFGITEKCTKKNNKIKKTYLVYTLGPIIHNPQAVEFLKTRYIVPIDENKIEILDKNKNSFLVIRSHGITKNLENRLVKSGYSLIDATCPFVKKAQNIANELKKKSIFSIIIGDEKHPEVIGIKSYANKKSLIINTLDELKEKFDKNFFNLRKQKKIGVLCQTTQNLEKLKKIISFLKKQKFELEIYNTICSATLQRQEEAKKISKEANVVLVIGGKNSSNTNKLFEICKKVNKNTFHIEQDSDIRDSMLNGCKNNSDAKVGIVTGTSTPSLIIRKVINEVRRLENNG
ncbi:MAG: 4-hydroxy-3-methylbut-2-enyl diphosphate reductase [Elusimicrobiota bacterium]|jgi:4-hydroxy-3-methylbut-2-enyl diphosphate reductase|nr:4-hydroxy-3-methylbut-2-enyl diphosphate reductase [Elusimicrobiota bacterium]